MAVYLAKFCPNFSNVTAPIRTLLEKDNEFCWLQDVYGKAFDDLKALLINAPVLAYFDGTKKLTVQCEACQSGLGAVCLVDGKPMEYAQSID